GAGGALSDRVGVLPVLEPLLSPYSWTVERPPTARSGLVELSRRQRDPDVGGPAGDHDAAVGEADGGVPGAGGRQRPARRPGAAGRVEQERAGRRARRALGAAGDQDLAGG